MKVYRELFKVKSEGLHPTFHDVTKQVKEVLEKEENQNDCVVFSPYHTCLVMTRMFAIDYTYFVWNILQQTYATSWKKLDTTMQSWRHQYMHPGEAIARICLHCLEIHLMFP